ncbi:TPM domain-containing protein [Alteraurantiacibacter aestuarii]|uniref:TPM domain-containing protein n=1 Tax=Alteraurantiacibacter aestuarii TaxID=650004 RepID=UPI0031E38220
MAILNDAQHDTVSSAVAAAEMTTAGEIVTVLAEKSDGYTDVALVWAAAVAFSVMSLFAMFPQPFLQFYDMLVGGWMHQWTTGQLASMTIALGLISFLATWALQLWPAIQFLMIPGPVKSQRVRNHAVRHFKVGAERRTHGRTGVLIYLSMKEHRAEIVADEPIAEKVPAEVWGEAMADMLAEVSKGCTAEGIAAGVRDVGKVLAEHFPRGEDDQNELPDRLIEL